MTQLYQCGFDMLTANTDLDMVWTSRGSSVVSAGNGRNGGAAMQLGNTPKQFVGSNHELYCAFAYKCGALGQVFHLFFTSTTTQFQFAILSDGRIEAQLGNGTHKAYSTNVSLSAGSYHHFQTHLIFATTTAGTFEMKVDGVTVTWDAANTSVITSVSGTTSDFFGFNAATGTNYVDDVLCYDNQFPGDVRLQLLTPNGPGNSTQWTPSTGSNYQNVDDAAPNGDTDYNSDSTAGDVDLYTLTDLTPTTGTVLAVKTYMYARKDDAGTRTIAPMIRNNSTTSQGSSVNVANTYGYFTQTFETNPSNGSAAWTVTDVNNSEIGVKLVA